MPLKPLEFIWDRRHNIRVRGFIHKEVEGSRFFKGHCAHPVVRAFGVHGILDLSNGPNRIRVVDSE
ncbi:hypothetical protein CH063_02746, partial [Colletotrichum higginsianum]